MITAGAVATALMLVTVIGVVGSDVAAPNASRRPLQTLPTLLRPTPASTAPSGAAVAGTAGTILDFTEDAGSMAADDHALAAIVGDTASARIVVTEIGRQRHVVEVTHGRVAFISPHGALRGNLVAYTEVESKDVSAAAPVVVWHVMVANWRTGSITELDAIPGEQSIAPYAPDYMPNAYTNGRDVIWLRTPRVHGELTGSELVLWRVLQGAGGAALLSTAQATLRQIFPREQQGMVQAIFLLGIIVAPTLGPTLGGWITDNYTWNWCFFINIPIGILSTFLVTTFLHDPPGARRIDPVDSAADGRLDRLWRDARRRTAQLFADRRPPRGESAAHDLPLGWGTAV